MDKVRSFAYTWGGIFASVICEIAGLTSIKLHLAGSTLQGGLPHLLQNPQAIAALPFTLLASVVLYIASPFIFAISLSRMEISVAFPAKVSLSTGFALLAGFAFLDEPLSLIKLAGCGALVISTHLFVVE